MARSCFAAPVPVSRGAARERGWPEMRLMDVDHQARAGLSTRILMRGRRDVSDRFRSADIGVLVSRIGDGNA